MRYILGEEIGRGGFGRVCEAHDSSGNRYAVKLVDRGDADSGEFLRMQFGFLSELDHKRILKAHDFDANGSQGPMMVTEFVDGVDLRAYVDANGHGDLVLITAKILDALRYLHSLGKMHRDIKPESILVFNEGGSAEIKLVDMGFDVGESTAVPTLFGTPAYFAPEIIRNMPCDGRADLYSLGATLYEMLTGTSPFGGSDEEEVLRKHLEYVPPAPSKIAADIDRAWDDFVGNLLRKEAFLRYRDATEAGLVLETLFKLPGIYVANITPPNSTPLVEREAEIEALSQLLTLPRTRGVLLCGERGSGVTRLIRETGGMAKLRGHKVLAVSLSEEMPGFMQIASEILGFEESNLEPVPVTESVLARDRDAYFEEILEAFQSRLPLDTTHILLIDRGEILEPREHQLLGALAARLGDRVGILVGYQMEQYAEDRRPEANVYDRIEIRPLGLHGLETLLSAYFGSAALPGGLAEELYHTTRGNPGLLQLTLEHLSSTGSLRVERKDEMLEVVWDKTMEVPTSVKDITRHKLADLSSAAMEALKVICVSGGQVDSELLSSMISEGRLRGIRDELVRGGFVEQEDGHTTLRLRREALSEVILERIRPDELTQMSLRLASLMEKGPKHVYDYYRLGLLYLQGGRPDTAFRYLAGSGDYFARFSARDALLAYRKALACGVSPELTASVEEKIGDLRLMLGELEAAKHHFSRALELRPSSLRKLGWVTSLLGRFTESIEILSKCKSDAEEKDDEVEIARVLCDLGYIYSMHSSRERGLEMLRRARRVFERIGLAREAATASNRIGYVEMRAGHFKRASRAWASAKRSYEEAGYRKGAAACLMSLGLCFRKQMDFGRAALCFKDALAILDEVKAVSEKAGCQQNYALLLLDQGQIGPAVELVNEALKVSSLLGKHSAIVNATILLAALDLEFGNWADAKAKLTGILDGSNGVGVYQKAIMNRYLAAAEAIAGNFERAEALIDESYRLAADADDAEGQGQAALTKAMILLRSGRVADAAESARKASTALSLSSSQLLATEAQRVLGEALCLKGEVTSGISALTAAREGFSALHDSLHMARVLRGLAHAQYLTHDFESFNRYLSCSLEIFRDRNARYDYALAALLGGEAATRRGSLLQARRYLLEAARIFEALGIEDLHKKAVDEMQNMPSGDFEVKAVSSLSRISHALNSSHDLTTVLNLAMDLALEYLGAERGVLMLKDEATGELATFVERAMDKESLNEVISVSGSIIESVRSTGEPVIASDATQDPRFKNSKSVRIHNIMSVMCVPLTMGDRLLGIIYLDSGGVPSDFSGLEKAFVEAFANQVSLAISNARFVGKLYDSVSDLRLRAGEKYNFDNIIGPGKKMQEVFRQVEKAAKSTISILLTGENGTGKELIAGLVHELSPRREKPLVKVNCAAIQRDLLETELFGIEKRVATGISPRSGFFERANGGTIFLDEVGDMPAATQMKVLRVLAEKEFERVGGSKVLKVDVRVISATNQDLKGLIERDLFRRDLYYRLNGMRIDLPPLRERIDDLQVLVDYFVGKYAVQNSKGRMHVLPQVMKLLAGYSWPGNVRELENCIEHAVVVADGAGIGIEHLPEEILESVGTSVSMVRVGSGSQLLPEAVRRLERRYILSALEEAGWVKTVAAHMLGIHESTLRKKMKVLDIHPNKERGEPKTTR
jgi:Nif-specific regulatory protein